MIAHAPAPFAARATPAAPPAIAPNIGSTSTRRKSMSRSISDCWGAPSALMTNVAERIAISGWASASPYRLASGPERATPRPAKTTLHPTVTQNAVLLSSSLSFLRWISAAPSARSLNTRTRLANTSARAARPYSAGVSRRATAMAASARVTCRPTCDPTTQPSPPSTRARRSGTPGPEKDDIGAHPRPGRRRPAWTVG